MLWLICQHCFCRIAASMLETMVKRQCPRCGFEDLKEVADGRAPE